MSFKRGWYWPWLVTAALGFTVGMNVLMFVKASGDKNASVVEPDYYRKAVEWDATMARRAASNQLGWRTSARIESAEGDSSTLVVSARDSLGVPLSGATFTATLIHNLDAARPVQLVLAESPEEGRYEAQARLGHNGLWEVRLEGRRDGDRFAETLHTESYGSGRARD